MASPIAVRYQGVQKESAGYKLLTAMGWKEGEGLGASKQGIKEHIKVKKKFENWGVGAVEAAENARNWTTGMIEFHRVLSTLSEITSQHAGKDGDNDDDTELESDASDHEKDNTNKKKSKKRKAGKEDSKSKTSKKNSDKKKSKSGKKSLANSNAPTEDDKNASDEEDDAKEEPEETTDNPKRVKLATHLGRFKRREHAKTVKNYSSHDLAAILGGDPFSAVAAAVTTTTATEQAQSEEQRKGDSTTTSQDDSEDEDVVRKKTKSKRKSSSALKQQKPSTNSENNPDSAFKAVKQVAFQDDLPAQEEEEAHQSDPAESEGKWWSGYFTRAGRLGSLRAIKKDGDKNQVGFSEQDQTDLYNRAQDNATTGRIGLGRSSMPKKVAGARWQGKKQRLGSDSDEDEDQDQEQEDDELQLNAVETEANDGIVIILPGGKVKEPSRNDKAATTIIESIKWKKVVTTVLEKSKKQKMKLTKLHKSIMQQHGVEDEHKEVVLTKLTAVVSKSSKFVLEEGGVVKLSK